jgi:hypothetical protein
MGSSQPSTLDRVRAERERRAKAGADAGAAFADAVQSQAASRLKSDALGDVGSLGLLAVGAGAAGRGALGLVQLLHRAKRAKKNTRSGPIGLPILSPPAEKLGNFLAGDAAGSKAGIPWYGPAMLGTGLAGLGAGWAGVDALLNSRRKHETEDELNSARQDFHDALMSQYAPKRADDSAAAAAEHLDAAFESVSDAVEKRGVDWSNVAGQAAGGYGMYAGLSPAC